MNILNTLKGLFDGKGSSAVTNATSDVMAKVSDIAEKAVEKVVNFEDINVTNITSMAEKFGVMNMLPEAIKSKLVDGTLSDEDLKSFMPEIKDMIMSKISNK